MEDRAGGSSAAWCVLYGSGIILMLGAYGVIQERMMSEPYGGTDLFRVSIFLVLCNRLVAILYALGMVRLKAEDLGNKAPLWKYIAVSLSNVVATTCQYEALKFVSFPVQMLGKSFKMMPVMLWSIAISGKKYDVGDWCVATGVTLGVTTFLVTGDISAKHSDRESSVWGLALLVAFLAFDGFTSTMQEKLFKEHKTSKYNQMLYVNSSSATVSAVSLLASGKLPSVLAFGARHPMFIAHASTLSAAAVAGQFFIYSQVKEYGALALAATMNVRQVLSILMSYVMYSHPISLLQLVGLVLVFSALFYKSYLGFVKPKPPRKREPQPVSAEEGSELEMQQHPPAETVGARMNGVTKTGPARTSASPAPRLPAE